MAYEVEVENSFFGGKVRITFSDLSLSEVKEALRSLAEWGYIDTFPDGLEPTMKEVGKMEVYDLEWPYPGVTITTY